MNYDFDVFEKTIAIIFSVLIILNGFIISKLSKTWVLPGAIISIFWFGYTFFPLVLLFSIPVNAYSVVYIFFAIFSFTLSSYFINWRSAFASNQRKSRLGLYQEFHTLFLILSFYFIQVSVVIIIFLDILSQGFPLSSIIFDLMGTSSQYIALRYSGELTQTFLSRVGTVFTYVGTMLGGLAFCASRKMARKFLILLLTFIPPLLVMVVQGAKGALFLCAVYFYATIIIYRLYAGDVFLTNARTNKNIFLGVVLFFPAIVSSFLSRGLYGYDADYVITRLLSYFASYALAHMYAFSDWFSFYTSASHVMQYEAHPEPFYGFYTFMPVFRAFGDTTEVPPGIYDEYFNFDDFIITNIYTVFRGLILDFGILGSYIFMFLLGVVSNVTFLMLLRSLRPYFSISFFAAMAGFYYTSFIISIFIWNSIFIAFILFAIVLQFNRKFFLYSRAKDKLKVEVAV